MKYIVVLFFNPNYNCICTIDDGKALRLLCLELDLPIEMTAISVESGGVIWNFNNKKK